MTSHRKKKAEDTSGNIIVYHDGDKLKTPEYYDEMIEKRRQEMMDYEGRKKEIANQQQRKTA